YIGLTRDSAEKILWGPVLKRINRDYNLGAKFNETDCSMWFPNGSVIYLLGVDQDADQKAKLYGLKLKLCVIDEASFWRTDLKDLIYNTIRPALTDAWGTLV